MANKEKLEYTKTTRYSQRHIDFINELENNGLNLRDVLEYYIINNTDDRKRLLNKERYLINHISELKTEIEQAENELKKIRVKLGKEPNENQETLDIVEARELVIERCKSKYGNNFNKLRIEEYLQTKHSTQVLMPLVSKYRITDIEQYKNKILKSINFD